MQLTRYVLLKNCRIYWLKIEGNTNLHKRTHREMISLQIKINVFPGMACYESKQILSTTGHDSRRNLKVTLRKDCFKANQDVPRHRNKIGNNGILKAFFHGGIQS